MIKEWWDENDLIPYSTQRWLSECDALHPSRVWRKLRNVARWIPVLWRDVDWDYSSLLEVVRFKIMNMRKHHREHRNHADWEEVAGQMTAAEGCLGRLLADDYARELWDAHDMEFPRGEFARTAEGMWMLPPMPDEARVSFGRVVAEEERLRQLDLDEFAHVFVKHVRGWWD